jgi:hypothetical protein
MVDYLNDFEGFDRQARGQLGDEGLHALFYVKAVRNERKTEVEGRAIYDNVEYIKIVLHGDRNTEIDRPASQEDKERFARQYHHWKEHNENIVEGTPLAEWPHVDEKLRSELRHLGLMTVEQVANVPDSTVGKLPMGTKLRKIANEFLMSSNDLEKQLRTDIQSMADRIEALEAENRRLKESPPTTDPDGDKANKKAA